MVSEFGKCGARIPSAHEQHELLRARVMTAELAFSKAEEDFENSIKDLLDFETSQAKQEFNKENKQEISPEQELKDFIEGLSELEDLEYEELILENERLAKRVDHLESRMLTLELLVQSKSNVLGYVTKAPIPVNPFSAPTVLYLSTI